MSGDDYWNWSKGSYPQLATYASTYGYGQISHLKCPFSIPNSNKLDWPDFVREACRHYVLSSEENIEKLRRTKQGRKKLVKSLYYTLMELRIAYALEPLTFELSGIQRIRKASELFGNLPQGTCLDLSLAFAGLCLADGLIPLLVILRGHIFVLVSLSFSLEEWDDPERIQHLEIKDAKNLLHLLEKEDFVGVECTGFSRAEAVTINYSHKIPRAQGFLSFENSELTVQKNLEAEHLQKFFIAAIDLSVAIRKHGLDRVTYPSLIRDGMDSGMNADSIFLLAEGLNAYTKKNFFGSSSLKLDQDPSLKMHVLRNDQSILPAKLCEEIAVEKNRFAVVGCESDSLAISVEILRQYIEVQTLYSLPSVALLSFHETPPSINVLDVLVNSLFFYVEGAVQKASLSSVLKSGSIALLLHLHGTKEIVSSWFDALSEWKQPFPLAVICELGYANEFLDPCRGSPYVVSIQKTASSGKSLSQLRNSEIENDAELLKLLALMKAQSDIQKNDLINLQALDFHLLEKTIQPAYFITTIGWSFLFSQLVLNLTISNYPVVDMKQEDAVTNNFQLLVCTLLALFWMSRSVQGNKLRKFAGVSVSIMFREIKRIPNILWQSRYWALLGPLIIGTMCAMQNMSSSLLVGINSFEWTIVVVISAILTWTIRAILQYSEHCNINEFALMAEESPTILSSILNGVTQSIRAFAIIVVLLFVPILICDVWSHQMRGTAFLEYWKSTGTIRRYITYLTVFPAWFYTGGGAAIQQCLLLLFLCISGRLPFDIRPLLSRGIQDGWLEHERGLYRLTFND